MEFTLPIYTTNEYVVMPDEARIEIDSELAAKIIAAAAVVASDKDYIQLSLDDRVMMPLYKGKEEPEHETGCDYIEGSFIVVEEDSFYWRGWTKYNGANWHTPAVSLSELHKYFAVGMAA